jgi:hypothetical protein
LWRKLRPTQLDEASGHYKPIEIIRSVYRNGLPSLVAANERNGALFESCARRFL